MRCRGIERGRGDDGGAGDPDSVNEAAAATSCAAAAGLIEISGHGLSLSYFHRYEGFLTRS